MNLLIALWWCGAFLSLTNRALCTRTQTFTTTASTVQLTSSTSSDGALTPPPPWQVLVALSQQLQSQAKPTAHHQHAHPHRKHHHGKEQQHIVNTESAQQLTHSAQSPDPTPRPAGGCDYGKLPGAWFDSEPAGQKWQTIVPGCHLTNLLNRQGPVGACPGPPSRGRRAHALLIGDSIDIMALEAFCARIGGNITSVYGTREPRPRRHEMLAADLFFCTASCDDVVLAYAFIPGVSAHGPWHYGVTSGYAERLTNMWEQWRNTFRLGPPDLVLFNSCLWDLSRLAEAAAPQELRLLQLGAQLPTSFLQSWQQQAEALVTFTRQLLGPGPVFAWHNVVIGAHSPETGFMVHSPLGRRAYVVQLNAAARSLAARLGLPLIDVEAMVQGFSSPQHYLMDHHHPREPVQLEMLNVALNLLEQLPLNPAAAAAGASQGPAGAAAAQVA